MKALPVIYLVKPGDDNEELRYSLRSLVNLPHSHVLFVGHRPSWVNPRTVELVPGNAAGSKWLNVYDNLRRAARCADRFVLMNDDFYVMHPVDGPPPWYRGTLMDHIVRVKLGPWRQSLERTLNLLRAQGLDSPLSYELHVPVLMEGPRLEAVLAPHARYAIPPQWRTMYGNTYGVEAEVHRDCKIIRAASRWDPAWPFLSTDDRVWPGHPAAQLIRSRFPDPCRYEVAG